MDILERYSSYGWTKTAICQKWGMSIKTFYMRPKAHSAPVGPQWNQLSRITLAEQLAVKNYALEHTELRHRELSYRMIDENIAYMSSSSVYRILKNFNIISQNSVKNKPGKWDPHECVDRPDKVWQTDLMVLKYKSKEFYLLSYLDVFSRFNVFHKLCTSMTGHSIETASMEAMEQTGITPEIIQSDNGGCYASAEYRRFIASIDATHHFIHPHCPNENAEIERHHRTLRELIDPDDADGVDELYEIINEQIRYYNYVRYHSRIGFIPPYEKYRGDPERIFEARKKKLEKAKEQRLKLNYSLWLKRQQNLIHSTKPNILESSTF